ncbi:MAG: FecR domain-containing protein [bacterium]
MKSLKRINYFSFVSIPAAVLLLLLAGAAIAQAFSVTVIRQAGKVEVKTAGAKEWTKSAPDMVLQGGDSIRTLKNSKVQLLFPGDAVVLIKENSQLNLKELSAGGGGKVKTVAGSFLFNLEKALSPGSTFEVESPGALAVVRGSKWAQFISFGGALLLVAFESDIEVSAGGETVIVSPGFETRVEPGGTPSDPEPSDYTEEMADSEFDFSGDEETGRYFAALQTYGSDLVRLEREVRENYLDFMEFYTEGNLPGMELIYRNVPDFRDRLKKISEAISSFANNAPDDLKSGGGNSEYFVDEKGVIRKDAKSSGDAAAGPGDSSEENDFAPETLDTFGNAMLRHVLRSRRISDMLDEMAFLISQFLGKPADIMDELEPLIPEPNPGLSIRDGAIDSDNDGLSDPLELELGLDPNINDTEHGLIKAVSPEQEEVFTWPADHSIEFRFIPAETDLIGDYKLFIEAGGLVYTQPMFSDSETLTIDNLLNRAGGNFGQLFADTDRVTFTWFVTGELDQTFFGAGGFDEGLLTSNARTFDIVIAEAGNAALRVVPLATMVRPDDTLSVQLLVEVDGALSEARIRLRFDPSVLEFQRGRTSTFWESSTLFFSDTTPGEVSVSGKVSRDVGFVTGNGVLCELDFQVTGIQGSISLLDLLEVTLVSPSGEEYSVFREDAQIEVI